MLVSLADIKSYLGIPLADTSHDAFLTNQAQVISDAIENYCGRKFLQDEYIQTFHKEDFGGYFGKEIKLFHYPIVSVTYVKLDDVAITDYRINKPHGYLISTDGFFGDKLEVRYFAGYATLPSLISNVLYQIVEQNYNRKISGVTTNFGTDVQRISISGVMSIDFDYTLDANQRKNAYGVILGQHLNVLDQFRSDRSIVGNGRISYVEEA